MFLWKRVAYKQTAVILKKTPSWNWQRQRLLMSALQTKKERPLIRFWFLLSKWNIETILNMFFMVKLFIVYRDWEGDFRGKCSRIKTEAKYTPVQMLPFPVFLFFTIWETKTHPPTQVNARPFPGEFMGPVNHGIISSNRAFERLPPVCCVFLRWNGVGGNSKGRGKTSRTTKGGKKRKNQSRALAAE